jgi:parvulin-like peptidyl-prolyl isomerase
MDDGRRNMLISAAFGGVVLVAIAILLGAIAVGWYTDNFGELAKVNGSAINRSEFRDRYTVEAFRIDHATRRLRTALAAGRISQSEHDAQVQILQQQREQGTLDQSVLGRLIDAELEAQLAAEEDVVVTDEDVAARVEEDATRPEERHAWLIAVDPGILAGTGSPTDPDREAARAKLQQALDDVAAGKTWQEVASTVSTDSSALQDGDLGYVSAANETQDPAFLEALFAATADTPTPIVEGEDGVFRAGLVTDIAPAARDADWEQQLVDAGVTPEAYQAAVRSDLIRERLEDEVVAAVVDADTVQRRLSEIFLAEAPAKARVRHILFAPNDDPQAALDLPEDDPAWAAAEAEARSLHTELAKLVGKDEELLAAFEEGAKASDEDGAAESGGLLPYLAQAELDPDFGSAVFAPGLERNDLLEPVKSAFGWHVILFDELQAPAQERIEEARQRALAPAASFATIAKDISDGPESVDGGDLGWVARGQLTPLERENAIFEAPIGGISPVLTVPGQGFYIFKVAEEATRRPDGEQAEVLRRTAYSNWYAAKRATADIAFDPSIQAPLG